MLVIFNSFMWQPHGVEHCLSIIATLLVNFNVFYRWIVRKIWKNCSHLLQEIFAQKMLCAFRPNHLFSLHQKLAWCRPRLGCKFMIRTKKDELYGLGTQIAFRYIISWTITFRQNCFIHHTYLLYDIIQKAMSYIISTSGKYENLLFFNGKIISYFYIQIYLF